jgi:hypothetical protein
MKIKTLNPEKNLPYLSASYPSKLYTKDEDFLNNGEENRVAMEAFLINNELNGGKTIRSYARHFELEDGTIVECIGTVAKNGNGTPGMLFMLKKEYFEDEEMQDKAQDACSDEFQSLFFKWHPKYFNKEWRSKSTGFQTMSCYCGRKDDEKKDCERCKEDRLKYQKYHE